MRFLDRRELLALDFVSCGDDVQISERAVLYGAEQMSIGNHVRIDDFAILHTASQIDIGSYVHIGTFCTVAGRHGVTFEDFCGIGSYVAIFTGSEDFSGASLTNPTVPEAYRTSVTGPVVLRPHAIVGTRATIMPNVEIGEGAVVGAHSFVPDDAAPWTIHAGVPARPVKERSQELLGDAARLLADDSQ